MSSQSQSALRVEWPDWRDDIHMSLDSYEGIPDWPAGKQVAAPPATAAERAFEWLGVILPGAVLAFGLACVGRVLSTWIGTSVFGFAKSPVSPILVAVVFGLLIRNSVGLPKVYERGLRLCARTVLQFGIVLLGLRLSLLALGHIGLAALPVVLLCIGSALLFVTWLSRLLGLPRRLGSLIAVGTSICGVSAIVATGPVIDAEDDEMSYAVACVTLFGLTALFSYPFFAYWLFGGDPREVGIFIGTAVHDTSQVAGAGMIVQEQFGSPQALNTAVVTKLVRNLSMIWVIPLMGILYHRRQSTSRKGTALKAWHRMIPTFIIVFVLMTIARTVGDQLLTAGDHSAWDRALRSGSVASQWCLTIAMAAVGLGTGLARLRALGWKPFCAGFLAAALVGGVSAISIRILASHLWHTSAGL
jgi:uncharacterized integral membrane protein (TIGR00698 family)